ncbi:MAG: UPF0149 family protein [Acidimicrobiia bacterium]|nr:UPF0149 family protein [Acidimicrobiia bacterium]
MTDFIIYGRPSVNPVIAGFSPHLPKHHQRPMSILDQPLSDAEIDTLDAFLMSDSTSDEVLSIDELHGFLTAIVCCPVPVMPSEWLPGVWRTDGGQQFASTEQARDITALIMRMHNDIAGVLQRGEELGPLMLETTLASGETVFIAQGWCWGFMEGLRSKYEAWEPQLDAIDALLLPVAALADLGDDDSEFHALLDHPDKVEELTDAIPESVLGIYRQSRSEAGGSAQPFRRQMDKVGRNDPCPCGSGKKYKKCCGAAATLH